LKLLPAGRYRIAAPAADGSGVTAGTAWLTHTHPHMIAKRGLSMYLPPTVTEITVPKGFLQTLSSSEFATR
jgi:hypothetical protein